MNGTKNERNFKKARKDVKKERWRGRRLKERNKSLKCRKNNETLQEKHE